MAWIQIWHSIRCSFGFCMFKKEHDMKKYDFQIFEEVDNLKEATLVGRSKRVAFMDVGKPESSKFVRMQGFTSMSEQKSPTEYSRRYVDEDTERSDVTGYATAQAFSFDRYSPFSVHKKLADIIDGEKLGSDTHVDIVVVDLFSTGEAKLARKRTYAVIPDTTGDGTDALIYSGTFRAASAIEEGTASSKDGWQTITYTPPVTDQV